MKTVMIKHLVLLLAGAALFFMEGCASAPVVVSDGQGFPLIDIVDAKVSIADTNWKEARSWSRNPGTVTIGGILGKEIRPKNLTIYLIETEIRIPIDSGDDLSAWFLNMPKGMTATATNDIDPDNSASDHTVITVRIEGVPEQTVNQPIKIKIPYRYTNRSWDFLIPPDEDKRFEVYGVDIAPVVVGGAVTTKIDNKTFTLKFGGTKLAHSMERGTNVTSWFTNLPKGLKATLAEDAVPVREGQQSLLVKIEGTPSIQSRETMLVSIPANITESGIVIDVPPDYKARYDIGAFDGLSFALNKWDSATLDNHWDGSQPWETGAMNGPKPYALKDFDSVGVIQLKATAKRSLREDGEFHWEGDAITYGALMAEAKKLGAHAIINVVVDYKDNETHSVVRRHVEAGHVPTPVEQTKRQQGILTVEKAADGSDIYVEDIREIERTYTGTALAIKWAPAYRPAEGDKNGSGYSPSKPEDMHFDSWPSVVKEVIDAITGNKK